MSVVYEFQKKQTRPLHSSLRRPLKIIRAATAVLLLITGKSIGVPVKLRNKEGDKFINELEKCKHQPSFFNIRV